MKVYILLEHNWDGIERVVGVYPDNDSALRERSDLVRTNCKGGVDEFGMYSVQEEEVR